MSSSKFQIIVQDISDKVSSGEYREGDRLPTERELANIYSVSSTTVVKALSELTSLGIINKVRGSGSYIAPQDLSPIIKGRKAKIGVLWTSHLSQESIKDMFYGKITEGILQAFKLPIDEGQWVLNEEANSAKWIAKNQTVEVEVLSEISTEQMRRPTIEVVKSRGFDGVITVGIIDEFWIDELLELKIPTVLIDISNQKYDLKVDQVYVDPIPAFRKAIKFLLGKGLKRIHFVAGYRSIPAPRPGMTYKEVAAFRKNRMEVDPDSYLRMAAYRQILDEESVFPERDWVHVNQPLEVSDVELAQQLLAKEEEEQPQAIFCHSIGQAQTILDEFSKAGKYIYAMGTTPDPAYNGAVFPVLARGYEMGAIGIDLLISKIQRPSRMAFKVGAPMDFTAIKG